MLQMLNYTSLCLLCIHLLQCISLCFVCCKGIKNIKRQKKWRIHVRYQNIAKTSKNQKKQKTKKKQNGRTCVPVDTRILQKPRKTKKNKMAEPMSQCLAWGQYFWFFLVFPGKTKKTKKKKQNGRTYVPVSGMGSVLLVFLFFFGFPR